MFFPRQDIDMAEVALHSPPSQFSTSVSASSLPINPPQPTISSFTHQESDKESCYGDDGVEREGEQISILAFLMASFRRSFAGCRFTDTDEFCAMEIGFPTNVRHIAHVTFDRFNGFLGLPVEFEREVSRRAPSASATVFGVSTESMQLSYDSRGNSVPTILLMMQRHLYAHGGLEVEGIFRITAGNSQEEFVREQLNLGIIPGDVDAHCLAGLIKAWFRELPSGVLDPLSPDEVMQCQTEEECSLLAKTLPATEAYLLDWAVNLMADVTQMEHVNKMNARNIAMVFAPNMTQMSEPLTALMYAVQVMNFLKSLIERALRDREDKSRPSDTCGNTKPSDENDPGCSTQITYKPSDEGGNDDVELVTIEQQKRKRMHPPKVLPLGPQKGKASFIVGPVNPRSEMFEAWR